MAYSYQENNYYCQEFQVPVITTDLACIDEKLIAANSYILNIVNAAATSTTMMPFMSCLEINSPVSSVSSVPDCVVYHRALPENEMTGFSDFSDCNYNSIDTMFDPGNQRIISGSSRFSQQDCYYMHSAENWGSAQGNRREVAQILEAQEKVERCSVDEKREKILRYLKKRNQRNFNKTIKYACRKTLADKRVRIRGRFAKNNEHFDENVTTEMSRDEQIINASSYSDDDYSQMMRYNDDEWLFASSEERSWPLA